MKTKFVKFPQVMSPQTYLWYVTGEAVIMNGDNDIESIEKALNDEGYDTLWSFPLDELDHIVENKLQVVLVDCLIYNNDKREFEHVLRWFEVPED